MDCTCALKLGDYIDGELSGNERQALEAHLATCETCRAEWALLQEVDGAMATWPVLAEPEGLAARVMDEIRAGAPRTAAPRVWPHARAHTRVQVHLRWQEALLGLALAIAVAVLVLSAHYVWMAGIAERAVGAVEWAALDLQMQQSLSTVERSCYAVRASAIHAPAIRADVGRTWADAGRVFGWVSSGIVLLAAAVTAVVLAAQWPGGIVTPIRHHRRAK
jgi:anti-sigma factor RsiW